MYILNYV